MKTTLTLLGAVLLGLAGAASAQTASDMQGMRMDQIMHDSQKGETAEGKSVIKAIDTTKGTVTIQHQAIALIHWPVAANAVTPEQNLIALLDGRIAGAWPAQRHRILAAAIRYYARCLSRTNCPDSCVRWQAMQRLAVG